MADEMMKDSELEQVTGGYDPYGGVPTNGGAQAGRGYLGDRVNLVGPYYVSSFAEGQGYTAAMNWRNRPLYAVLLYPGRAAGYRVREENGNDVGWAPRSSLEFIH